MLARIAHLKQYQHHVRLRWEQDRAGDKNRRRDLALAILTHVYRTRYSYMNHWEAIRQQWTPVVAKEYDRPTWSFRDSSPDKPWKIETAYTHEETDARFREDLAYFQPQPLEEKSFSEDLIPGGFQFGNPAATRQRYQGGARYAFYTRGGEPLDLTIVTGVIAWYRDRPDAVYTISDSTGKEITKGRLPQDSREHPLAIQVPRPGLYWLEFNDQAAGWGVSVSAGRSVSLVLRRGSHPAHMGHMQRMFFYVPKGTREIEYYSAGYPHEVYGPDASCWRALIPTASSCVLRCPRAAKGRYGRWAICASVICGSSMCPTSWPRRRNPCSYLAIWWLNNLLNSDPYHGQSLGS